MNKLNKLIMKSRVTEVFSAANRMILEFGSEDWSEETNLRSIFDDLKPVNEKLERAINRKKAVSDLEEKDKIRDGKLRAIYYSLSGYLHNPVKEFKTAAEEINEVFDRYGVKITDDSYSTESGLINSLLTDLSAGDLQPSIAALQGLSQAISELQTAQSEFENARLAYEKDAAVYASKETASKLKKEAVSIINEKLVVYLRAMVIIDTTRYGRISSTIGKIIDDNNEEVKKRRKKTEPEAETA
ncbi:MAG: DUF6261 family protein [Ignavibacteria bacterium]|jgi:hypothetical protein